MEFDRCHPIPPPPPFPSYPISPTPTPPPPPSVPCPAPPPPPPPPDNLYKEQLQRRCCADGMLSVPMPYSCTRRSLYITEDWDACVLPFRRCCARYSGQEFDDRRPHTTAPPPTPAPITTEDEDGLIHLMGVGRHYTIASTFLSSEFLTSGRPEISGRHYAPVMPQGPEDEDMLDVSYVSLRVQFFESWMWRDLKLPTTPGHNG